MSVKGRAIAKVAIKAVVGGLQLAGVLWAAGFWFGMGQRHGEKEADWVDDIVDKAITKRIMKRDLKDFVRENQIKKGEKKEMFNRLFNLFAQSKNENLSSLEFSEKVDDILSDYRKEPEPLKEVKKEESEE